MRVMIANGDRKNDDTEPSSIFRGVRTRYDTIPYPRNLNPLPTLRYLPAHQSLLRGRFYACLNKACTNKRR